MYPFFDNVFIMLLEISVMHCKSNTCIPSFSNKNLSSLICFSDFIFLVSISNSISSISFFKYTKFSVEQIEEIGARYALL